MGNAASRTIRTIAHGFSRGQTWEDVLGSYFQVMNEVHHTVGSEE